MDVFFSSEKSLVLMRMSLKLTPDLIDNALDDTEEEHNAL